MTARKTKRHAGRHRRFPEETTRSNPTRRSPPNDLGHSPPAPVTTIAGSRCAADETGGHSEADQLGAAVQAQLAHAVGPVAFGGAGADPETPAGLGAAQPLRGHPDHLALAR